MKKNFWLAFVSCFCCLFFIYLPSIHAQTDNKGAQMSNQSFDPADLNKYEKLVQKEPDNYEHHLALAKIYCSMGKGIFCADQAQKAISLNLKQAAQNQAYIIASMGYYYDGQFKKSYEMITKAVEFNPKDQMAQNFKNMLEQVSQEWGGKIPEKITFGGYTSAEEAQMAYQKRGVAVLGSAEDTVAFDFGRFYFEGPKTWGKRANVEKRSSFALLQYKKHKEQDLPLIAVTADDPDPRVKSVIEYTNQVKIFMEQSSPTLKVDKPVQGTIKNYAVSYIHMLDQNNNLEMGSYQFLIKGKIISVQYANAPESFSKDFQTFKALAFSIREEKNK